MKSKPTNREESSFYLREQEEEELDYDDDSNDSDPVNNRHESMLQKHIPSPIHKLSPKEEGEALSEEEGEVKDNRCEGVRIHRHNLRKDREEGEASSEDEQTLRHKQRDRSTALSRRNDKKSVEVVQKEIQLLSDSPPPELAAKEEEYRRRLAERQRIRFREKEAAMAMAAAIERDREALIVTVDSVNQLIPQRSKFESSPELSQTEEDSDLGVDIAALLQNSPHKRSHSKAKAAESRDRSSYVSKKSRRSSKDSLHRSDDSKPKKIPANKHAGQSESQPDLSVFSKIQENDSLHRESSDRRSGHGSRSSSQKILAPKADTSGSGDVSPSFQQSNLKPAPISRSPSSSPPAHLRNRSRSPPRDRPSRTRRGHHSQKRKTSSSHVKSSSHQKRKQIKQDELISGDELEDKEYRKPDEIVAVKRLDSVSVTSLKETPLPSPSHARPQVAPIDGSRFKYASSDEEDDDEDVIPPSLEGLVDELHVISGEEIMGEREEHGTRVAQPAKPYYYPSIQGCRSVDEFECLNRIEEGTYGVVYRARDKKTLEIVALKRLKMEKERDGFPITSLREINTLMKAQHENIVTVREVVVGNNMDKIYLVMDYVEHDLKALMEIMSGPFTVGQVGDFGLAREYGSPLKHYTEVVVTLWYRAPELLLGAKQYSCPIDLWSVGCIFAEFLLQRPLFPGKGEVDELNIIFRDLGTPNEHIWPGVTSLPGMKRCVFTEYAFNQLRRRFTEKQISDQGFDLLNSFLTYCPERRITAEKALKHQYFNERPRAIDPSMFPTWPAKSEGGKVGVGRRGQSPKPPPGGGALAAAAAAAAVSSEQTGFRSAGSSFNHLGAALDRLQQPPPPLGGQRFYARSPSRPSTAQGGSGALSVQPGAGSGPDQGFLLRF